MKDRYYVYAVAMTLLLLLLLPVTWHTFSAILSPKVYGLTLMGNLAMYKWTALGALVAYAAVRVVPIVQKNLNFLSVLSHEATHMAVALLCFRKMHSFHAEERSGVITSSGSAINHVPVALAPYCLPLVSYPLLFLRSIVMPEGLWIYDILLGITLAFHLHCFRAQTGNWQPDINQYPLWFSYLYIWTARLLNLNVFLLAFWSSLNCFTAFRHIALDMWDTVTTLFAGIAG